MNTCPSPETLLLAKRLAVVADLPETGAWIVVDDSHVRSLYLDLIECHRGPVMRRAAQYFIVYREETARRASVADGMPVYLDPAYAGRSYPERPKPSMPPAPSGTPERDLVLVGKPEHIELIFDLMAHGFALRDLVGLDIASLGLLALQADLAEALAA